MGQLGQDLRFAVRTLLKAPVFTLVAVLSIAFGIGANTAIFTLLDQILLRSLPVKDPGRLVMIYSQGSNYGNNRGEAALSYPMYQDFRGRNTVFSGVICRYGTPLSLSAGDTTERVTGELVSGNYFQVLGVEAARGRTFTPADDTTPGAHPVAMLSYGFWQQRFAGDPHIIGKQIRLNGYPMTVIGVSPEGFDGTQPGMAVDVRVPMMMKVQMTPGWDDLKDRRSRWVNVFARLKPGVSIAQAHAEIETIFHQILKMEVREKAFANATPYTRQQFLRMTTKVVPASTGFSMMREQLRKPLLVLMALVGFVLLIACANVANLLMARATARQKEIAVRLALGAGRLRIVRQLLVESVVLAVAGGIAGLLFAYAVVSFLLNIQPPYGITLTLTATPDVRILAFTFGVALATGIVFGLVPAIQATRTDVSPTLKDQAQAVSGGVHVWFRKSLVVAQVALSVLLLVGAGLFIQSLRNLRDLNPGFRATNLIAFDIDPTLNGYSKERCRQMYRTLQETLDHTPGVVNSALAVVRILEDDEWDSSVSVEGYDAKPGEDIQAFSNAISPGYFATLGIPLLEGRDFNQHDILGAPKVIIVNRSFEKHYFGDRGAIGRHVGFGGDPGTKLNMEIVGVVGDSKYMSLRDAVPRELFQPNQEAEFVSGMTVFVRTERDSAQMTNTLRKIMHNLDANVPVYNIKTIAKQLDDNLVRERLIASMASAFGVLATLLSMIGLYGVMAYSVTRRTREIGLRMALGAVRGNVLWLVMREVLTLSVIGLAIGVPAAIGLARFVKSQLYGVTPADPLVLAGGALLLALVAALAGYIPALRATRIDPMNALRYE